MPGKDQETVRIQGAKSLLRIEEVRTVIPLSTNGALDHFLNRENHHLRRLNQVLRSHLDSIPHRGSLRLGRSVFALRRDAQGNISNFRVENDGLGCIITALAQSTLAAERWPAWPDEVRREVGAEYCDLRIECLME